MDPPESPGALERAGQGRDSGLDGGLLAFRATVGAGSGEAGTGGQGQGEEEVDGLSSLCAYDSDPDS